MPAGTPDWPNTWASPAFRMRNEMLIVAGGMLGGVLGFLWFNCHPAQVFMGDTGSLPLGGLLGLLAVVARQEFLLLIVGGVFVAEALSVILQVGCYRATRKRIFRCAPLHHHFEFQGWAETQIVVRFWIASAFCAMLGMVALRFAPEIRPAEGVVRVADARARGKATVVSPLTDEELVP